ncbi:MAG: right-handed parallel beta-helix repeat-containing protein [Cyclobacteriaceae bacterium]
MNKICIIIALFCSLSALATDYYVAKDGSDSNIGTEQNPFLTIGKAASIMVAGDICYIKEGTYRETLSPANSGSAGAYIAFKAYAQDEVVISATETIDSWTNYSGAIYKASVTMPLGVERNMLFAKGHAMDIARWPNNADNDPFTIDAEPVDSGTGSSISRTSIPNVDWSGGYVWYLGAHSGASWTRLITSSTAGTVNYQAVDITKWPFNPHNPTVFRNNNYGRFYLFGTLGALDYPGEWYYDDANDEVYFNAPNDANPESFVTEYTARIQAINITKNYIEIDGIEIFGGNVIIAGSNNVLKNCTIRYGTQRLDELDNTDAQVNEASVIVRGSNNLVDHNLIEFSSINGLSLTDAWNGHSNNTVSNNVIRYSNTVGNHSNGIRSSHPYTTIENNTVYACGRDGFYINGNNSEISYNDVYDCMRINNDGGVFYVVGNANDKNSVIHHNWFHDSEGPDYADGRAAGIYLDNHSKGYTVHHNVVWNITWSGIQINWDNWNIDIYNNSIYEVEEAMGRWAGPNGTNYTIDDIVIENNYASITPWIGTDVSETTNIISSASPFESVANKQFTPVSGSALIDAGVHISGITDGFSGSNPDVGAYEVGGTYWVPGIDWEAPAVELLEDAFATKEITIQYDMSPVASSITGAVSLGGPLVNNVTTEMTDKGNNIYEVVLDITEEAVQEFGVSYVSANGVVQETVPSDCEVGASSATRLPTVAFEDSKNYAFRFGNCQISTFESNNWDVIPKDHFLIRVKDDVSLTANLKVSEAYIGPDATVTVANNSTFEIDGPTTGEEVSAHFLEYDFESMTTQALTNLVSSDGGVTAYEVTSEAAYKGTKSLKLTSNGSTNNFVFSLLEIDNDDLGEYTFSFYAKSTAGGSGLQRWRYVNWAGNQLQISSSFTSEWQKFTLTADITQTGTWLLQLQPATTGDTYYDEIQVTKTGALSETMIGDIMVASGSSLITYAANNNAAEAKVYRNKRFADGRYSFVGSPVANPTQQGSDLGQYVYGYNETIAYGSNDGADRWIDAKNESLAVGRGYAAAGGTQQISFTGLPNDGDIVVENLTITDGPEAGWQLLCNPYPAALHVESVVAGLGSSVYLWDDGGSNTQRGTNADYMIVSQLGHVGNGPNGGSFNGYIGSMQGFFIKLTGTPTTSANITFSESMRVTGQNADTNFFRKSGTKDGNLRISVQSSDGQRNELLIGVREDATIGFDPKYDAVKLTGNQDLSFYSLIGEQKMAIQGLAHDQESEVALGIMTKTPQQLALTVKELGDLPFGYRYLLFDQHTQEIYDLREGEVITIYQEAGKNEDRLRLYYTRTMDALSTHLMSKPIYRMLAHSLRVDFPRALDVASYTVMDISGKVLLENSALQTQISSMEVPIRAKGMIILKMVTSEGTYTRKLMKD